VPAGDRLAFAAKSDLLGSKCVVRISYEREDGDRDSVERPIL
jgi:hypothetical protein